MTTMKAKKEQHPKMLPCWQSHGVHSPGPVFAYFISMKGFAILISTWQHRRLELIFAIQLPPGGKWPKADRGIGGNVPTRRLPPSGIRLARDRRMPPPPGGRQGPGGVSRRAARLTATRISPPQNAKLKSQNSLGARWRKCAGRAGRLLWQPPNFGRALAFPPIVPYNAPRTRDF